MISESSWELGESSTGRLYIKNTSSSFWLSCNNQILLAGDRQHLNKSEVWPLSVCRPPSRPCRLPDISSGGGAVSHQRD